jgi:non-homologous end joining protein Ku
MIEKKAAGEEIAVQPQVEEEAPVPDLMAALKASLESVRAREDDGDGGGGAKKPAAGKKSPAKKTASKR